MDKDDLKHFDLKNELESEIFALISSIINLHRKYKEGNIKETFFHKAVRNALNGLTRINFFLKDKNKSLSEVIIEMKYVNEFNKAAAILNEISSLNFLDQFELKNQSKTSKNIRSAVLELPRLTSEITSSFITLMDALKLEALRDFELIDKLFTELKQNVKKFPELRRISIQIKKILKRVKNNKVYIIENKKFRETIVEEIYEAFKEFQKKLNLKP